MQQRRGFALIEVLVAVVILGLVLTTSLAIFFDRQKRLRHASEMILAYQAIANEAEVQRHLPIYQVTDRPTFTSLLNSDLEVELGPLQALADVATSVEVESLTPVVKEVTLTVTWNKALPRTAQMKIFRTPAGDYRELVNESDPDAE